MSWSRWYAIKSYLFSTMWISPIIAIALEQVTFRLAYVRHFDFGWVPGFVFDREESIAAMDYMVSSSIAFLVFTFSSLLVAIQVSSGQMTPRIIATTLLPDKTIRSTVAIFAYALLLAIAVRSRIDTIPHFLVSLATILGLFNLVTFIFLIDYAARLLRPVSIMVRVAERGLTVLEDVYPEMHADKSIAVNHIGKVGPPDLTILHEGRSAIVIAINLSALIAIAKKANCIIEVAPRVGDFVALGDPLFLLRGAGTTEIDERALRGQVAFGSERTIEQDATFAFRVIVDIAIKALSPGINDPTTAVLAIDQLQRLLRTVGQRSLHDEKILDENGQFRLIFRTPNWTDFVQLTFAEIRQYGAESFQVGRRLRAMIENVMQSLPEDRRPALRQELALLDRAAERYHVFPEDLALARVSDSQGLGGSSGP
jgi:uncharacterized membrane protein